MTMPARRAFAGLDRINLDGLRFRFIDAEGQVVGRLAAQLAKVLQGKDKPTYAPNQDCGDVCVVVNAEKIVFTGRKWTGKLYQWHTGHPGGLREMTARELWRRDPAQVLMRAVEGMLPKNNLQRDRLRKLRVFSGPDHPFGGLHMVPWEMPPKQLEDHKRGWAMPDGFVPMNAAAYALRMRGSKAPVGALPAPAAAAAEDAAVVAAAAAQEQRQLRRPVISFEDLLAADERQFIDEVKRRGAKK